ncbi:MAG: hypothetical protein LBP63_09615 [Prevotellaceae bacterium]|jgi:hypothetical protein|nr:hypothetical protein [Prevotellaceae bacterium]
MKRTNKIMAIIAISSMVFASCSSNDDTKPQSILEREYFTVQNATVEQGELPQSSTGDAFRGVTINSTVLPGGSSFVSLYSEERLSEIYISVDGVKEYYRLPVNATHATTQAAAVEETNLSNVVILFSQNLSKSFTIQLSARTEGGEIMSLYSKPLEFLDAGTGTLQVSLSFDNDKDVDLYVVEPNGNVIYWNNRGSKIVDEETGESYIEWGLDIDSNAECYIDGINNENIYYPEAYIQSGKYEVWVNMYNNCDESIATNWVITATKEGALVPVTYGENPQSGIFPVGEPSNSIGRSLEGALKVMEFTMNGTYNPPAPESAFVLHNTHGEKETKKPKSQN